ncbi:MAG TPA: hypothetical protein PKE66_04170, partial [Pyrinomonadaceae bacterium]|nr:hypothetical protein [Pyrinomonadaceae bacterium]
MKTALPIIRFLFLLVLFAAPSALAQNKPAESAPAPSAPPTGKAPIIIIPGITGSELKNSKTDKLV